jgi:ATP-dependent helicase/nuclease subunit B
VAGKADGTLPLFGPGRIYAIPPAARFLDTLAVAILRGVLTGGDAPGQHDLAKTLVYLPDHAACRGLEAALLRTGHTGAMPRLRPLGSAEADALRILEPDEAGDPHPGADVPPAIGALERRMVLTRLILAWADRIKRGHTTEAGAVHISIAETPAAASELALGLMQLMDEADTEGVDLGRLRGLLPERFAAHEQLSLSFLDIVIGAWPAYLEASGRLGPMARLSRLVALEAEAVRSLRPDKPVIVAGSLGMTPATAALLEAAYVHPRGAIVLPGADLWLDDAGWRTLADHPEHPQEAISRLLTRLGASRADITPLPGGAESAAMAARARFIGEAMRPSSTVAAWPGFIAATRPSAIRAALADVSLIAAPTVHDEAAAIAVILREAAETPGRTASLVTPDRMLARRVRAQLGRWGLHVPDAGGAALSVTLEGVFHQLVADAAATGSRIALLALIKHPLTRLGLPREAVETATPIIEIGAIRQPWGGDGVAQLARALAVTRQQHRKHPALDRLSEADWDAAEAVAAALARALQPLTALARRKSLSLQTLAEAHRAAAARLMAGDDVEAERPDSPMATFIDALTGELPGPALALRDYPALLRNLLMLEVSPEGETGHPALRILAPREARLASADTVIIAGLNEGVWPEPPSAGPWLNRAMRDALGLPPAERQTGIAAHDFTQLLGAPEVILTRALKAEGTPTIPSRWLLRIEALLGGFGREAALAPKRPWLAWAAGDQTIPPRPRAKPPAPRPPLDARPRQLSVSEIATLIANPYAIHARHVLGLRPLDALEAEPGGAERGRVLHETLHRFVRSFPAELPANCAGALMDIFDSCIAPLGDNARIAAFWRPRMERFARWFAETEPERRMGVAQIHAEVSGELIVNTPRGTFTIRGAADRIDVREDGSLAIYDYKSGALPTLADIAAFRAPHLPLQALIAGQGHFRGVEGREVAKLAHLSMSGGEPAGAESAVGAEKIGALVETARDGLEALLKRFADEATPYTAMRRGGFSNRYAFDSYAHLARVEEWSGVGEEG